MLNLGSRMFIILDISSLLLSFTQIIIKVVLINLRLRYKNKIIKLYYYKHIPVSFLSLSTWKFVFERKVEIIRTCGFWGLGYWDLGMTFF